MSKNYELAAQLYSDSIPLISDAPDADLHAALTLGRLGMVNLITGETGNSQTRLDKSIKFFEKMSKDPNKNNDFLKKEYIRVLTARAELARTSKDLSSADQLFEQSLQICKTVSRGSSIGDSLFSDDRLRCLAGVADVESQLGKDDDAIRNYKLALQQSNIPDKTEILLRAGYNQVLARHGSHADAQKISGVDHSVGLSLAAAGQWNEKFQAGNLALGRREFQAAERYYLQALGLVKSKGTCSTYAIGTYEQLLVCMFLSKQFSKSNEYIEAVRPCLANFEREDKHGADRMLRIIALLFVEQHKYAEAENFYRRELELQLTIRRVYSEYHAATAIELSQVLMNEGKFSEAEPHLTAAQKAYEQPNSDSKQLRRTLQMLMQCYQGQKKTAEATELRQKYSKVFQVE